jgi:hypothetical protein
MPGVRCSVRRCVYNQNGYCRFSKEDNYTIEITMLTYGKEQKQQPVCLTYKDYLEE